VNKLFPIPLLGAGTSDVESLASYIHRIAYEHGLYVGELLRYIHREGRDFIEMHGSLPKMSCYIGVHELIRPNRLTKMIVNLLDIFTSQNLKESTLWFMDSAIGRSTSEVSEGFRWCRECLAEMEYLGQEMYFKLVWHMSGVEICAKHRLRLSNICDFCGCNQTTYRKHYPLGRCQQCGYSLSSTQAGVPAIELENSWELSGVDLLELFTDLAKSNHVALPKDGVLRSLDQLFDYYWSHDREAELYELMSRDEFLALVHRQTPISLKVARRMAYRLGLSLYTLMSGNAQYSTGVLSPNHLSQMSHSFLDPAKKMYRDHVRVIAELRKIITSLDRPPSLKALAENLNVSVGYLEYRFPMIVREVVDKHKAYADEVRRRRQLDAQNAALQYFLSDEYLAYPKSRKQAYIFLRKETRLPKFVLKRAIQNAYELSC
jgi:AraC-like DNA-binding protein